jgi:hypothetical protein
MAKYLQLVLDLPEPIFSHGLAQMERATGNSGVDVRLIADIMQKAHAVMRHLNLDIRDTTAHELYLALNAAVTRDEDIEVLLTDTDYVLFVIDDKIISFNLIDVIENSHHKMPIGKNIISHGQRSLRGELVGRYIDHVRTDETMVREVVNHIGLLPEGDAWYTNEKYKRKHVGKVPKESIK